MIGRNLKTVANEFLRNRRARTGAGPRRLPPTCSIALPTVLSAGSLANSSSDDLKNAERLIEPKLT